MAPGEHFSRPYGTCLIAILASPALETLGYFRISLREEVCGIGVDSNEFA
jgi:hypothetical protein